MNRFFFLILLLAGCNVEGLPNPNYHKDKSVKLFDIVCKHPRGHILVYKVDAKTALLPHNFRGGLWSFKDNDGTFVRSTNCHVEISNVEVLK